MIHFFTKPTGEKLAYMQAKRKAPHFVFLPGFKSDMSGSKAVAVEAWCEEQNLSYTRFDYRGHGQSDGAFLDGCIGDWLDDVLDILDHVVAEPCILIGSSMGGWIALLAALKRPAQIQALVGIAAAPDFTERLMWQAFSEAQKQQLTAEGVVYLPSCYGEEDYAITKKLIDDGREHLILSPRPASPRAWDAASRADGSLGLLASPVTNMTEGINITCPIRLLHGMADEDVPWQISCEVAQQVASDDVQVHLLKNAGHRMSEPEQLALLMDTLSGLV